MFKASENCLKDNILDDDIRDLELSVQENNTKIIRLILEKHVEGFSGI